MSASPPPYPAEQRGRRGSVAAVSLLIWEAVMKPPLHSIMTLVVASIVALCLLATPVAIDWNTLAIDAAHAVANGLGDVADGVGDSIGDAANSVGDSLGDAANSVGDSVGSAADRVGDSVGSAAERVGDSVGSAADRVGDSIEDASDDVADSVDTGVTVTVREFTKIKWQRVGDSIKDRADDVADSVDTGVTVIVREFTKIGWKPGRGSREAGDHRLPLGPRSFPSTVAAIEPSAGLAHPGCATDDGKEQGAEISCLIASFEAETRDRQIAYAPPGDRIYRLEQVEARRYSDRDVPVLVIQGLVSNMSNRERSVPPLLAIVQDDQGKELMRWTFRAEAERLGPGASTGFRSEMFDPQSKSAKVTIVFAPEQQTMQ
jgi:hypothetical protein